ncbi:peptide chain release factor N(5)-glutamine methyltransferase [Methylohalobius crimeensis]|uniref:peptide chain release factor N(5)-glutamine methyltransferase n=1 Tax=Methylohalobius crimeensis TaxID=244365 RepID=UPI0003B3FEC4|nr:peptide chain release factor N(5)-glutamine methyltransferase [Methylohalobius crimeensis]
MTTISELLRQGSDHLGATSASPQLDAELLLAHATGSARAHLRAWPEKTPDPEQQTYFRQLLERRRNGEPVAYILGRREFWSHEFLVGPGTLVPRPDTELLLEQALLLLPMGQSATVADLGTGSGAIALSLALERPQVQLIATDTSPAALALARINARRLGACNVTFLQTDWLTGLAPDSLDGIVSNPPYIPADDPHLQQDIRFEPAAALIGGNDGLDAYRRLISQARRRLRAGGFILLEHGYDQSREVADLLADAGFSRIRCHRDLQGHPRVTQALWSP